MRHSCSFFILLYSVTLFSHLSFFFNDTATTEIYTLSLHDALPILTWLDVEQGHLGDCYFASSLSAVLFADKADRKSTRLNSSHTVISYAVFCLKKKKKKNVKRKKRSKNRRENCEHGLLYIYKYRLG